MPISHQQRKNPPQSSDLIRFPLVQPVHTTVRGRARFKIPLLYRARHLKAPLEKKLQALKSIHSASINPVLGSVLIQFDPAVPLSEIIALIQQQVATVVGDIPPPERKSPQTSKAHGSSSGFATITSIFEYWTRRHEPKPDQFAGNESGQRRDAHGEHAHQNNSLPLSTSAPTGDGATWHSLESAQVLQHLDSDFHSGLTTAEASQRLAHYGPNQLLQAQARSPLQIFLSQFNSLPVWLLGASAGIAIFTGGMVDAAVILGVVLINATIGFVTERYAERTLTALAQMDSHTTVVLREGQPLQMSAEDVVPGDVILLAPGNYVPADIRLLAAKRLSLDESALTGESLPVAKDPEFLGKEETPLGDRLNMSYMGTMVTGGNGRGVVVATGTATEIGKIQAMVGSTKPPETPMERQLDQIGTQLAILSAAVCGGVYVVGLLRGYSWLEMLKSSISLAVAAVPEGLPPVATTTLALGMRTMNRRKVLIRRLDAVETLGSVQVICLDKTGTLTENRMTVVNINTGRGEIIVNDGHFYLSGDQIEPAQLQDLLRLFQVIALCNESELETDNTTNGSSTENALLEATGLAGIDIHQLRQEFPRLETQYRAEGRNYMKTTHASPSPEGKRFLAVKGSPSQVLAMCHWHTHNGKQVEIQEEDRAAFLAQNEAMAADSLRVLGIAYTWLEPDQPSKNAKLTWLGLVGMSDPVRTGMAELMNRFHAAGIDTVMITGDQSATAYAIGKQLSLAKGEQLQILDSTHLEKLDPELLSGLVQQVHVFSRVSPAHKLQIVQAMQRAGKVVAMTGDGINDSPALKAADIGIAMGSTGTEVARGVADVVLEDDNLHTMVGAVEQGRTIYGNIRKSIHFLLATNFSEIEVMLAAIALGLGQPLNPMQLLWINLITDIFPGLALALDPPDKEILNKPPRDPQESIIQRQELKRMGLESAAITAGSLSSYGYALWRYGPGPKAGTHAFTSLTLAQLLHSYSCRSPQHSLFSGDRPPPNPYLNWAVGGSIGAQVLASLIPGLRNILGITPISLIDGLVIGAGATLPFLINEATKPTGKLPAPLSPETDPPAAEANPQGES